MTAGSAGRWLRLPRSPNGWQPYAEAALVRNWSCVTWRETWQFASVSITTTSKAVPILPTGVGSSPCSFMDASGTATPIATRAQRRRVTLLSGRRNSLAIKREIEPRSARCDAADIGLSSYGSAKRKIGGPCRAGLRRGSNQRPRPNEPLQMIWREFREIPLVFHIEKIRAASAGFCRPGAILANGRWSRERAVFC
jgi:hypothetical protein